MTTAERNLLIAIGRAVQYLTKEAQLEVALAIESVQEQEIEKVRKDLALRMTRCS